MDTSLVIPTFGAEKYLEQTLAKVDAYLSEAHESWELILVVDGNPHGCALTATRFARESHPYEVKVVVNEKNSGKGANVRAGILAATGNYQLFTDCDLAYALGDIDTILSALKRESDVAVASRVHPDSRYLIRAKDLHYLHTRHIASRLFNRLVRATLVPHCNDTQAGLKGFRKEAAQFLFSQTSLTGFSFDIEILYLAHRVGLTIEEVPIRYSYQQEPSTVAFVRDAWRMGRDIVRIFFAARRGKYPPTLP